MRGAKTTRLSRRYFCAIDLEQEVLIKALSDQPMKDSIDVARQRKDRLMFCEGLLVKT